MSSPQMRRHGRERALQFLFGLDFTAYDCDEVLADFWRINPTRPGVKIFAEQIIRGVCEHRDELDAQILKALRNWSPERIGRIEKAVLRIALYEMLYSADVPSTVAINEALEVVKRFGGEDAPRFINGVLDRINKGEAPS